MSRNESLRVVRMDGNRIMARNERGEEREFTAKQIKAFDVYEQRPIEVAPQDKLLLLANQHGLEFRATNGEIVTISKIDEYKRVHLEDGRTLPENYGQFTHGYAVTAHRSQGKSVDAVILSGDGMRRELFYVAASRGRESISIVTSDKERLRESISHSDVRQSAVELDRKTKAPALAQYQTESNRSEQSPTKRFSVRDLLPNDVNQEQTEQVPVKAQNQTIEPQVDVPETQQPYTERFRSFGMER